MATPTTQHAAMITEVEAALARLLDPSTPAPEKAEIEQQLAQLKAAPNACLPVLYQLLSASSGEYALWFAATTLEEYIAKTWAQLPVSDQQQLRQFAWEYLLARSSGANATATHSAFVVRKLRKVVADIARLEWRSNDSDSNNNSNGGTWPDFMQQVESLVVDPSTRLSGLELLHVIADEFGRDDALAFAAVKRQARAQLTAALPQVLALLSNVLQGCSEQLQSNHSNNSDAASADRVAREALETLTALVLWAPVAEHVTDAWIALLFALSASWATPSLSFSSSTTCSVAALQCLTELMGKRLAPSALDSIVAAVMRGLCPLLQTTVADGAIASVDTSFLDQLSAFVEAFLTHHVARLERAQFAGVLPEFLTLVLAFTTRQPHVDGFVNCLSVWEVFVSYIEDVELNEGATSDRRAALNVYENGLVAVMFHLVDRINYATNRAQLDELDSGTDDDDSDENGGDDTAGTSDTADVLSDTSLDSDISAYGTGSLQDLAQLSVARTSGSDSNAPAVELSDRKQFVVDCIALIRRIAAFPSCAPPLLERLMPRVHESCATMLFRVHETPAPTPHSAAWTNERHAIRDLTANVAVLASVSAQYYGTSTELTLQMAGWRVLHLVVALAEYVVTHRLQTRGAAFVALECEALTAVRFCLACVPFVVASGARDDVLDATERVLCVLLATLDTSIVPSPHAVMANAMQLLANLGAVLAYDDLVCVPAMVQLERDVHQFSLHLPLTIQGDLYTSMAHSILNSAISLRSGAESVGASTAAGSWTDAFARLLLPIRESLEASALTLQQSESRVLDRAMVAQVTRDCFLVRSLARAVETKPKIAKDAFFATYNAALPALLALLRMYVGAIRRAAGHAPTQVRMALKVVNEIIRLYAQLLQSVRKEMAKDSVADLMRVFVEIFSDAHLTATLNTTTGNAGLLVLCGFLQLLRIVVEEPTAVFASFLQNILELCFGPLKEAIFAHSESDSAALSYFIALVEQLLEKHYRFFVSPRVTFNADGQRERGYASDAAHAFFVSIFQSVAGVLSRDGASPRLCAQVLALLDRVDRAQGLFAFAGFQTELRMGFLSTLMNLLTRGEMNLLQDEVIQLLHRVAAVDFASFYQTFLATYIREILAPHEVAAAARQHGELLHWSGQVDLPTFATELLSFLNDIRVLKAQS